MHNFILVNFLLFEQLLYHMLYTQLASPVGNKYITIIILLGIVTIICYYYVLEVMNEILQLITNWMHRKEKHLYNFNSC